MKKDAIVQFVMNQNPAIGRNQAHGAVSDVFMIISEQLMMGCPVSVAGFGKFEVAKRASRNARNPKTGEKIVIPERQVVRFRPAKQLRELVDG